MDVPNTSARSGSAAAESMLTITVCLGSCFTEIASPEEKLILALQISLRKAICGVVWYMDQSTA